MNSTVSVNIGIYVYLEHNSRIIHMSMCRIENGVDLANTEYPGRKRLCQETPAIYWFSVGGTKNKVWKSKSKDGLKKMASGCFTSNVITRTSQSIAH